MNGQRKYGIHTQRSVIHTEGRVRPCHLQKKQMEVEDTVAHKYWDTECQVMFFLFLVCGKLKQNKTKGLKCQSKYKGLGYSEWGIRQRIVGRVNMWLQGSTGVEGTWPRQAACVYEKPQWINQCANSPG